MRGFSATRPVPASAQAQRPESPLPQEPSTDWARTPVVRGLRAAVQRGGLAPLVRSQVRLRVTGLDSCLGALEQGCVVVMNHASHLDTAALLTALPASVREHTAVAAAADYFFDSWWRGTGTAIAFGTVPIDRRGGRPSQTPLELLKRGWTVVVFPEGTRSRDGWTAPFRVGAAHLAIEAGVPIVPVAVRGSFLAMPRGRSWPVPGRPRVSLSFGSELHALPEQTPRSLADRCASDVARLLDEDQTDWYASLLRAQRGETPASSGPVAAGWRRHWEATRPVQEPGTTRSRVWR
jgi:1-acyl-sn-glycerol-3-phosphate acyltransferase